MRTRIVALACCLLACRLLAGPAVAQPLDAAAFQAMAENRTLHFRSVDGPYGAEQFLPGRRSLWRFAGDAACRSGSWYQQGPAICFRYEEEEEEEEAPNCWRLERTPAGVVARMEGGDPQAVLSLERIDTAPLPCPLLGPGS